MAKVKIKTTKNDLSVADYLNGIKSVEMRRNAKQLAKVFKQTTGAKPKMWGTSIVGYGEYIYYRSNGDDGLSAATGFSIRNSGPTLYIMPGYTDFSPLLKKIGPHKLGKSCLYLKNLEGIDLDIVSKLVAAGIKDLKKNHEVKI
jgi:glycine cleavage system protein P-like pyridoxal-binding family